MSGTSSGTPTVEIIQAVARKRWTTAQKLRIVEESMQPGNSASRVARVHGVSPALLYKWRKLMLEGGATAVDADDQVVSMSEVAALKKRISELERALGRKTLENDILKAAVELGRKKTDIARALVRDRGFRIGPVARALFVSRSNLYELPAELPGKRGPYTKIGDADLLPLVLEIVDECPTYGYRRVWAMLNRELLKQGLQTVSHNRVYRLMKKHGLLLASPGKRHATRAHKGKIAVMESDQRWCSDGFELTCDNGEKVRAIFVLDCCDQEAISIVAATSGFTAKMAQNALLEAIGKRFGSQKTTHWVEWLTDNGSCFIAKDTLALSREVGIINCFTPVRSPESNGMAEAFVKTIKRDYASCTSLPDAVQVTQQLTRWIEDYNENAPHKGLRWLSPREFRKKALPKGNFPGAARVNEAA